MGITLKKLKSGTVFLAQKRVNGQRESKTFVDFGEAEKWMTVKTLENEIALTQPTLYNASLKKLDRTAAKPLKREVDHLELFRTNPDAMDEKDFIFMFNAVADYERKPVLLKRYKEIIAKLRKEAYELD